MSNPKPKILIVEDEKDISELMALHLRREGFEPQVVDNGEAARAALRAAGPDASYGTIVLDWMLPGLSGLDLCRELRREGKTIPILMVTARAQSADIVQGLDAGADDYLTKPFELSVFLARVRALLRRSASGSEQQSTARFQFGQLAIDFEKYLVSCQDQPITLTPSEFKLLAALAKQQGRVLTRERLIELVQGEGVSVVDRAIDTHIFGLRKKLGACADIVETVRGVGYRVKGRD
jgi:two-component system phosphate regulon response regulator PhoB